ncbi:MAG: hypothetical protein GX623_02615 [Clostridiales bacterium]|nr:hypothetical protein [Clostridiales bacterium]
MDLSGQVVLAYLEEDDARHVLFRVRPLLTTTGGVSPEDLEAFEQDGFLRIAPDKQEQHSFKDRMRSLGTLCLINLANAPSSMGKVRPNKNYAPHRGETNRYIVYSDAVQALPEGLLYEVVSGDKAASLTPQYYLRSGGRISGPYALGDEPGEGAHSLPPDCDRLFLVEMPDKSSRMFYWPQPAQPDPAPPVSAAAEEAPPPPEPAEPEPDAFSAAVRDIRAVLSETGFDCPEPVCGYMLLLCVSASRLQLAGETLADARLAAKTLSDLCGDGSLSCQGAREGEGRPTRLMFAPGPEIPSELVARYLVNPWPVCALPCVKGWPAPYPPARRSLDYAALREEMTEKAKAAPAPPAPWPEDLPARMKAAGCALPLVIRRRLMEFARLSALYMPKHAAEAREFALRCWAEPWLLHHGVPARKIAELLRP